MSSRAGGTLGLEVVGSGPRVVLVHGSIANAKWTWPQQLPLGEVFTLVLPNRTGYPPNPPLEQIDFYEQANEIVELLDDGSHLVGFSYGGVVALLAAARRPAAVRSLTVIEPPAFWLARGTPEVDDLVLKLMRLFWCGPREPRPFAAEFLELIGGKLQLPKVLPPELEQGVRALMAERPPWDARLPLDELERALFPKLVVSGAHSAALDAVSDELERRVGAERIVMPGAGHMVPSLGVIFNERLTTFIQGVERQRSDSAQP